MNAMAPSVRPRASNAWPHVGVASRHHAHSIHRLAAGGVVGERADSARLQQGKEAFALLVRVQDQDARRIG
jgi:hypothetical protein